MHSPKTISLSNLSKFNGKIIKQQNKYMPTNIV